MDSDVEAALAAIKIATFTEQKILNVKKGGRERNGLSLRSKGKISMDSFLILILC